MSVEQQLSRVGADQRPRPRSLGRFTLWDLLIAGCVAAAAIMFSIALALGPAG